MCIAKLQQQGDLVNFLWYCNFLVIVIQIDSQTLKVKLDNVAVHLALTNKWVTALLDL